jgi:hypothetical protein
MQSESVVIKPFITSDFQLDAFRQIGDPVADEVVGQIMDRRQTAELFAILKSKTWKEAQQVHLNNEQLRRFVFEENQLPSWAERDKIHTAAALFRGNGNEFLFMLGIVSLPYCYAAANGALALFHTEKIRKNTEQRLLDTTSFVIEIMKNGAFEEGGEGFFAVKQVRLRHALARFHLLQVPELVNLKEMPINQEDMAGTNLAFSYVALKAMPLIGVRFDKETQNAYLHFWSAVGYLMGMNINLLPNNLKHAFWLERAIARRQFKPSIAGHDLTAQLVQHYKDQIPNKMTTMLIKPLMRHLLGGEVSSMIGLSGGTAGRSADKLMLLLPLFKKYIFPPVQSFEFIVDQIDHRRQAMIKNGH